jgi:adenylylsulfate kinase
MSKQGKIIWLTGLSGAGKTTISVNLKSILEFSGHKVEQLDGDDLRKIFPGTGFTKDERIAHCKRIAFLASRLAHHGITVIVSLISPYQAARDWGRFMTAHEQDTNKFYEVYVKCPIDECQRRDPKGLYKKVKDGQISNMTGIDDPYEEPENPDLILETDKETVLESVEKILKLMRNYEQ